MRHDPRPVGTSNYGLRRIASLVLAILFSYSCSRCGLAAGSASASPAAASCSASSTSSARLFVDSSVPGWTTIAVLLAVFNGFVIMLLSMLGEYVVRTLNAVSAVTTYHVTERVSS